LDETRLAGSASFIQTSVKSTPQTNKPVSAIEDPMSDAHSHQDDHSEAHEGPIKTPKQLVTAVVLAFLVPIAVIVLLVSFVASGNRTADGKALDPESVARRIERVGQVEISKGGAAPAQAAPEAAPAATAPAPAIVIPPAETKPAAAAAAASAAPPALYASACAGCHVSGAGGAPKVGDKAAWASRLSLGVEGLTASVIKGKGIMPARGGSQASDDEIKAVVAYMVNNSK
jgi:cytochrome c5